MTMETIELIPLILFESITDADMIYLELNYKFQFFFIDIETLKIYGISFNNEDLPTLAKIGTLNILGINELEIEL